METKHFKEDPSLLENNGYDFHLQHHAANSVSCHAHIHNAIELLYIKQGSYTVMLDNKNFDVLPGDLVLFSSNSIHHVISHGNQLNEYYVIKISLNFLTEFVHQKSGMDYVMRFTINRSDQKHLWRKNELENSTILSLLKALVTEYESKKYATEIALKLKIAELLLAILRDDKLSTKYTTTQSLDQIYKIIIYIREHYFEDINEEELARKFGMSYSHFMRSFRKVTGTTFRQHLNITRINHAEQMLYNNRGSVSEVAGLCGYNSVSYFINVYHSIKGKTPYRVLKEQRNSNEF